MVSGHTKNHKIQKIGHPQIMFGGFYKYLAIFKKTKMKVVPPTSSATRTATSTSCSMVWALPQREIYIVFKMWVFQRIEKCDREMNARETLSWHDILLPYKKWFWNRVTLSLPGSSSSSSDSSSSSPWEPSEAHPRFEFGKVFRVSGAMEDDRAMVRWKKT